MHMGTKGGYSVSSIALHITPLNQGLFLNMVLGFTGRQARRQQAPETNPPVSGFSTRVIGMHGTMLGTMMACYMGTGI